MKLIHVQKARSIWLLDLRDLNPRGKDVSGDLIDWIKVAYEFATAPDNPSAHLPGAPARPGAPGASPQAAEALVFQRGRFKVREELFIEISSLSIYNDGIVVDTLSSTQEGDLFATDLLETAAREFALNSDPGMVRRRVYISELVVWSEVDFDRINQGLAAFAQRIGDASKDGDKPHFRVSGFSYWSDPNDSGVHRIFSIERQAGRTFKERRYYSQAPLQTHDHLRLLEELEQVLMA